MSFSLFMIKRPCAGIQERGAPFTGSGHAVIPCLQSFSLSDLGYLNVCLADWAMVKALPPCGIWLSLSHMLLLCHRTGPSFLFLNTGIIISFLYVFVRTRYLTHRWNLLVSYICVCLCVCVCMCVYILRYSQKARLIFDFYLRNI